MKNNRNYKENTEIPKNPVSQLYTSATMSAIRASIALAVFNGNRAIEINAEITQV